MENKKFDPNKVYNAEEELALNKKKSSLNLEKLFSFYTFCNISFIITVAILGYSFIGDLTFKLKHLFPKFSYVEINPIDVYKEPVQTFVLPEEKGLKKGKNEYTVFAYEKIAEYSISGMLVAINTDFWLRGIMRNDFDKVSLMDIGIVWGKLADKEFVEKNLKFKSEKTSTARWLRTTYKCRDANCPGFGYVTSHLAHTHLVPANDNIMSALLTFKKYNNVKLDGYLIDIHYSKGGKSLTSTSRTDNNAGSRGAGNGGGACEIMYVTKVQIRDKVYE